MHTTFSTSFGQFNPPEGQEDIFKLLLGQIERLQGATGPVFSDISGAFGEARGAAEARQGQATGRAQANALERAAAKGKTLSSAQTAAQSRIEQEGATNLSSILASLGIQEQGILGEQAVQTSRFEEGRRGQINELLGLLTSIEESGVAPETLPTAASASVQRPDSSSSNTLGLSSVSGAPAGPGLPTFDIGALFGPVGSTQREQQRGTASAGFPGLQGSQPTGADILSRLGNVSAEQMQIILPFLMEFFGQQSNTLGSFLGAQNSVLSNPSPLSFGTLA